MRLRLRIERHALPSVQAVWPVPLPKSTVAQLLEEIDNVFPLEAENWGLEDYSVTLHGFELLHYHELGVVCKDEDELVIRPLSFAETRSRTLTGRDQITSDGRHLLDGIPFGKPCLRGPMRPDLWIPPKWEREGDERDHEDDEEPESNTLALTGGGEEDDEDDDDDGDFELEEEAGESEEWEAASFEEHNSNSERADEDETSSAQSSDTNVSSSSSSSQESAEESDDDSSSDSSSNSSSDSSDNHPVTPKHGRADGVARHPPNATPQLGSKRKSGPEAEQGTRGGNDLDGQPAAKRLKTVGVPFEGLQKTKQRNARRRDTKRLKFLVEANILPKGSTLQDLKQHDMESGHSPSQTPLTAAADSGVSGHGAEIRRQTEAANRLVDELDTGELSETMVSGGNVAKKARKNKQAPADLESKRQALLAQIAAGGVDVSDEAHAPHSEHASDHAEDDGPPEEISYKTNGTTGMIPPSVTRRAKLDITSSKRLLFGSLGVRVPKTQADREKVQQRLSATASKRSQTTGNESASPSAIANGEQATAGPDDEDPDAWRTKIKLRAVECYDEGVVLSEPPFPFQQLWDPQQSTKRSRNGVANGAGVKKGKRKRQNVEYMETYDKYNTDGYGDGLDYDDPQADDSELWEDGALLGNEYDQEEDWTDESDLPPLPNNMDDLPPLAEDEAQEGDCITFTELACDASTNWQPKTVTRSARLAEINSKANTDEALKASGNTYILHLAERDRVPIKYDDEGNRVWTKFEMPDDEHCDEAGIMNVSWADLVDVRLLRRERRAVQ